MLAYNEAGLRPYSGFMDKLASPPAARGLRQSVDPCARRLRGDLGPGVPQRHLRPYEPFLARRPGKLKGESLARQQLASLRPHRPHGARVRRYRVLCSRRLFAGDLRRRRAGQHRRGGAAPVRRVPRDRPDRLVPHAQLRVPHSGRRSACDFPACRKTGGLRTSTYVQASGTPGVEELAPGRASPVGASSRPGRSCLLEVDGRGRAPPNREERIGTASNEGASARPLRGGPGHERAGRGERPCAFAEKFVAVVEEGQGRHGSSWKHPGRYLDPLGLDRRCGPFRCSRLGTPDAESHTNPIYVYLDGKAPTSRMRSTRGCGGWMPRSPSTKARTFPREGRR